jgi:hypothetical protein
MVPKAFWRLDDIMKCSDGFSILDYTVRIALLGGKKIGEELAHFLEANQP